MPVIGASFGALDIDRVRSPNAFVTHVLHMAQLQRQGTSGRGQHQDHALTAPGPVGRGIRCPTVL